MTLVEKALNSFPEFLKKIGPEEFEAYGANSDIMTELQDLCSWEEDIKGLETYVMSDGSYVTRLREIYRFGNDIDDKLTRS